MRWLALLGIVVVALAGVAACQRTDTDAATAPADCARVADTLASFELGPSPDAATRAAAVAKHKAACTSAKVTNAEASCLYAAKETWAARACLPRMFSPKPQQVEGSCALLVARLREAVMKDVGSNGSAAAQRLTQLSPVYLAACEQDHWPTSVVSCASAAAPGDIVAFQACFNQLPPDLQQKLSERFSAALQQK